MLPDSTFRLEYHNIFHCNFLQNAQNAPINLLPILASKLQSIATVKRWYNRDRCTLTDESRVSRSKSLIVSANLYALQKLVRQDRHVISSSREKDLCRGMKKILKRWSRGSVKTNA